MIRELISYLTSRAAPGARKAGLVSEVAGIAGRHSRNKEAWQTHLRHTKECITANLYRADEAEPVLCIGAGLCLDVPLDALNAHPAGALLMDGVETRATRRALKAYPNLEFELADVTGLLAAYAGAKPGTAFDVPPVAPLPLVGFGMAISLNILSQLPLPFADSPPADDAERKLTRRIQKAHVRALMAMSCPVLLITDYERIERGKDISRTVTTVERDLLPGDPIESWRWHIAPEGEVARGMDISLNVGAWLLGAAL